MENNTNTENESIAELKNKLLKQNSCDLSAVFKIIGGKWKIMLIKSILQGCPKRFGELRRELEDLAQTTLTTQLRELERDGIISRKIYAETPPRVEYKLTPLGLTLIPVVQSLEDWWHQYNAQRADV